MLRRCGATGGARQGRREAAYLKSTGPTEDAAWRRLARRSGTSFRAEWNSSTGCLGGVGEAGGDKDTSKVEVDVARPEAGAGLEPAPVVARLLDEERPVEPVRLADPSDDDAGHLPSSWATASSRVTATRRFSATKALAPGQPLASISRIARS